MVVAVIPVRVVQVSVDEVVDVVPVRNRRVPTSGPVDVVGVVAGALVLRAALGVGRVDVDRVLVVVVLMRAVKVPVMEVTDVVPVLDGDVTAVGAVRVVVAFVNSMHVQAG